MKSGRGFTIVEVVITMTIMVILAGLGTVVVTKVLPEARDRERENDVTAIARALEERYKTGNPRAPGGIDGNPGSYPGHNEFWDAVANKTIPIENTFPGLSDSTLTSPDGQYIFAPCWLYFYDTSGNCNGANAAGKEINIKTAFLYSGGAVGRNAYVYEASNRDNAMCNSAAGFWNDQCSKFSLYWISETDKTPYLGIPGLKVVRSKHQ